VEGAGVGEAGGGRRGDRRIAGEEAADLPRRREAEGKGSALGGARRGQLHATVPSIRGVPRALTLRPLRVRCPASGGDSPRLP
jgi:hypothetical protein